MVQRLSRFLAVALFAGTASMAAEDATLTQIRTLLAPMRANPFDGPGARGAKPALTTVKHKLRDWIESRLLEFQDDDAARAFAFELNAEIHNAGLWCDSTAISSERHCPLPGYIGDVKLNFGEVLVVTTAVGIVCGFDESAYAYSFSNGRWKRFWQSETNNYVEGQYVPLNFLGILFSSRDYLRKGADPNIRLLLVLARDPAYCESNWYNVYQRVWQLRTDRPEEKLLLDKGEEAFLADWVDGTVSPDEVLVEYTTRAAFTDLSNRRVVWHYVMRSGILEREDPLALSPRDFVDEWMRTPWDISSRWTSIGVPPRHCRKCTAKRTSRVANTPARTIAGSSRNIGRWA